MSARPPRRFYLLTYPRTASNLLVRILALEDQADIFMGEKNSYFFGGAMASRMHMLKITGRRPEDWTQEERTSLTENYQEGFDALHRHVEAAEALGQHVFVKEHLPWFIDPISEAKHLFGENSTDELPWTVTTSLAPKHSPLNESILPDAFLRTWFPTFLIRHPALAFPSCYRTSVDNEGAEAARSQHAVNQVEMSVHWSRALYDWYTHQPEESGSNDDATWPVILDADDVIEDPDLVRKYSRMVGLDPSRLKFAWASASEDELNKMDDMARRMTSTLDASTAIVSGKTSIGLDIDEEAKKWKVEFGEEEGERIERLVRAAMPDYEYMKARRLRPQD
ncbi:uncharacterized protein BDZ99DRAFT_570901 [Mytilinidion resinicola]|uniref:P-loop containing nucleoside triphosphate hydrolase protein n=1 Tax=Mytilinidion resinicola TaxID=574789 RepID=A0A6A6YN62_9PEZI|nr:uncharacterized protein BDZ99DRAFT_570901 [Mytilinidion resinicola]KAF2810312.1 hypothetical protein BDZ99DRAFT_570901 [Mytilinidion resinicola]